MTQTKVKAYCNHLALQKGLDPGGSAYAFGALLLLEVALPWTQEICASAGKLPQEVLDLYALYQQRYRETGETPGLFLAMIAPDKLYSKPGWRRIILFQRKAAQMAQFARAEYFVPEELAGSLLWALAEAPDTAARFDRWRLKQAASKRDLLVCTHGSVDAACAKFGYPLYRYLRDSHAHNELRVWRVSHFGGHVFAPTLLDMPNGRYWGYVEEAQARQIVQQSGAVTDLNSHYRGWAGLENGFLQVAERAIWQREGWQWFNNAIQGEIVAQDAGEQSGWAEVLIRASGASGSAAYRVRVEIVRQVETIHTTGNEALYPYPQYAVRWLERHSSKDSFHNSEALMAAA